MDTEARAWCSQCYADMPPARLAHPSLKGLCSQCWSDDHKARPALPVYETDAWSRGIRLD